MRQEFSDRTKDEAYARSGGICECARLPDRPPWGCGQPLGEGNTFYEHIICCELGGDNSLENCAALTKTCWKTKTKDYDLPQIAKAKRRQRAHAGIKAESSRPMPCGRKSPWKKTMSGRVVAR